MSEFVTQRTRPYLDGLRSLPVIPVVSLLILLMTAYWSRSANNAELTLWVVFFSASISSIAGFAFSPIAGAVLFHYNADTVLVVQTLLVASLAQQVYCVFVLRSQIKSLEFLPYVFASLATLPLGILLLLNSRVAVFLPLLGLIMLAYGSFVSIKPAIRLSWTNPLLGRILAGALGGITGGLAAFPAAFVAVWCQFQGFDKERQRSVVQPFILVNQIVALIILSLAHPTATASFETIQYAAPAILGAHLGLRVFRRLSTQGFNRIVGIALAFAGILMIAKAL